MSEARKTLPTGGTLLTGRPYVHSTQTDIRARFEAIRASLAKPAPKTKTPKALRVVGR